MKIFSKLLFFKKVSISINILTTVSYSSTRYNRKNIKKIGYTKKKFSSSLNYIAKTERNLIFGKMTMFNSQKFLEIKNNIFLAI